MSSTDGEVVPVVDGLYAALVSGGSVIDALRTAKLRSLSEGPTLQAWAALLVIGDPLVTYPSERRPGTGVRCSVGEPSGISSRLRTSASKHCLERPIYPPFNHHGTGSPS